MLADLIRIECLCLPAVRRSELESYIMQPRSTLRLAVYLILSLQDATAPPPIIFDHHQVFLDPATRTSLDPAITFLPPNPATTGLILTLSGLCLLPQATWI